MRLILGSRSPRRLELLSRIGVKPDAIRPPDVDESPLPGETPRAYCLRIADAKVAAVQADPDDVVLCADTTVGVGRRILGKPRDRDEAGQFLDLLSGRRHRVVTALALRHGTRLMQRHVETLVRMKRLSGAERDWYLDTGEWQGKAGGYAIQGQAAALIPWISGSFTGVVGLPLAETAALLDAIGYVRGKI